MGRGCLAGPVVAAAVILPALIPENSFWRSIRDSKLLSAETREELSLEIRSHALAWSIGISSVEEIEKLNILWASHQAMVRSVEGLQSAPDHVLVDGDRVPRGLACAGTAIIKGDQVSLSIAAASVLAKVHRDQMMCELDAIYPGYGLAVNKGYGVPVHLKALQALGPTEIHRKAFAPVKQQLGFRLEATGDLS